MTNPDHNSAGIAGRLRVVVIGGSGHIGTFLIPRLVRAGHEVISISRSGGTGSASPWSPPRHSSTRSAARSPT